MNVRVCSKAQPRRALTLVELLVVLAIIGIFAMLLLPPMTRPKGKATRVVCWSNLRQIELGLRMYLDDNQNVSPGKTNAAKLPFLSWTDYRPLLNIYVGVKGTSSPNDRVFACPADSFFYDTTGDGRGYVPESLHSQSSNAFTSYTFNAGQVITPAIREPHGTNVIAPATTNLYGLANRRLDTVAYPFRTAMIGEAPAYQPYAWHEPRKNWFADNSKFNNAYDLLAFADGHVANTKMYYSGQKIAWAYNPPAGYSYQWTAD